ncbi:hypothetical protein ZIOFF_063222 [Zingiber officinale]|uniref:Uncharacterized protein n=1 Tax=Zingiber officinale TaxID=94328 RepID=A0A8J5F1N2_ZINOF|nr:hypothetical protein ZIOFF_063222 [Zingiber officinale]
MVDNFMNKSYTITKNTLSYKEIVKATEHIESPAVGFAKPNEYQGLTSGNSSIVKQNNTQIQLLVQIVESFKDIQADLKTILKQTRREVQTSSIPEELIDKLKNLSLGTSKKPKEGRRQLRVFHDSYKILQEDQAKIKN